MRRKVTLDEFDKLVERVEDLEDKLRMPHVYSSELYSGLYERTTSLWAKFSRLFDYLGVEDVVIPETRAIRVRKLTKSRANTKPSRKLAPQDNHKAGKEKP